MNTPELLLLLAPGLPLLLVIGLLSNLLRRFAWMLAPWAALPALLLSLMLPPHTTLELPWLLFGIHLGLDQTARVFLFFSAVLWLVAGIYATGYFKHDASKRRFFIGFLLAMAGNLGLILAQDMIVFFSFFALMSFASYALVIHTSTSEALRAGRIYIILVVVGEVILFAAFAMAALVAGSLEFEAVRSSLPLAELRDWIIGLVLLGFGIKAGVIGLHVWLPLAHPVAPIPASAVLSGAMIAAGLLGWLRILPMGEATLTGWGEVMMVAGILAIFYAVLVGLVQSNPKTVLAYSSISKMGLMTMAVGLGLTEPDLWPLILSAILIFALHHGLAKGALFLGVGMAASPVASKWQGYLLLAGLLLPALALAGAPWTSGMMAKNLLKLQVASVAPPWNEGLQIVLLLGSIAASMLMVRFLYLVWQQYKSASATQATSKSMWLSWSVLLLIVALNPWFIPLADPQDRWAAKTIISALWPVALGAAISIFIGLAARRQWISWSLKIPPGDLLLIVENRLSSLIASGRSFGFKTLPNCQLSLLAGWNWFRDQSESWSVTDSGENRFGRWAVGSTLFLVLAMVFIILAV